jgi:hypothetical protein
MFRAVLITLLLGACGIAAVDYATLDARRPNPDVNEPHTIASSSDPLIPVGSVVKVQCAQNDGTYLATALPSLSSILVITVTVADLDARPRGPFTETCAHWQARHQVQNMPSVPV